MTKQFLALGDSYTIGEGVAASERWPMQLATALRGIGVSLADPRIVAKTGWTTGELLSAIEAESLSLAPNYDLVSLLIGVNDHYRGEASFFANGFEALLARAVSIAEGNDPKRVVVISIPDWSVTPFGRKDPRGASAIAREIDELNQRARDVADRLGAPFVDITADSRRAASDRRLLAKDSLHPSAEMYASWVPFILPAARRALSLTPHVLHKGCL